MQYRIRRWVVVFTAVGLAGNCNQPAPTVPESSAALDYQQDLAGCASEPARSGGVDELPGYDDIPAPAVPRFIREAERPAQVDLSTYVPTPCNQGALNSCAGWAGAYGLMTYLAAANVDGWVDLDRTDRQFSPTFVFNQANAYRLGRSSRSSCREAGTFLTDMLTLLRDTGCATWLDLPYSANNCDAQPAAEIITAAQDFRIAYFRAVQRTVADVKSYLSEGIPVLITLRVGDAFMNLGPGDVYNTTNDTNLFAHAVLAVGYDDAIGGTGAIKIMNSWGTRWGDGGFGFISYDVWLAADTEAFVVGKDLVSSISSLNARILAPGTIYDPLQDTDDDGYPDTMELEFGLDPQVADPNPDRKYRPDSDADGWPDDAELTFGTNPRDRDSVPFGIGHVLPIVLFDLYLSGQGERGVATYHRIGATRDIAFTATNVAVGEEPRSVSVTDVDGDGDLDLAVPNAGSNDVTLLINDGHGVFTPGLDVPVLGSPTFVTAGDLNGDGLDDLALGIDVAGLSTIVQLVNDGRGGYGVALGLTLAGGALSAASADLTGDGAMDLAVTIPLLNQVLLLANDGHGGLETAEVFDFATAPTSLSASDLNGDGDLDLVVGLGEGNGLSVLENTVGGVFQEPATADSEPVDALTVRELNNDGYPDLVTACFNTDRINVLLNDGAGNLGAPTSYAVGDGPTAAAVADLNNDGWSDIVVTNQLSESISVLANLGEAVFAPATHYVASGAPIQVVVADLDNDGDLDVVTVNGGGDASAPGSVTVLLNQFNP